MDEFDDIGMLAVAQAYMSAVGDAVKTGRADNLRGRVDAAMRERFERDGSRTFDVRLMGETVGTYSVRTTKPEPQKTGYQVEVYDPAALAGWAGENADAAASFAASDLEAFAKWCLLAMGVEPDGARLVEVVTPATPGGQWAGSALKVDRDAVADVVRRKLPDRPAALLEGGF